MDQKAKKEVILILALLPVLFYFGGKNLIWPKVKAWMNKDQSRTQAAPFGGADLGTAKDVEEGRDFAKEIDGYRSAKWARNPFHDPTDAPPPKPEPKPVPKPVPQPKPVPKPVPKVIPTFEIQGIVWNEDIQYALINGEVREVGDVVDAFEVISISESEVILKRDEDVIELKLFQNQW